MSDRLVARFVVLAEAERAATQLRAAGLDDADVAIDTGESGDAMSRTSEVGVPDDGAGLSGLRGGDEPQVAAVMTVEFGHARLGRDEIVAILHAAGGRTD